MKTPLRFRQIAGLSLLELMLAVALGVTLTAAVVQLFAGSSRSHAALGGQARLQESARHALGFLARSARNAGYRGCASGDSVLANALHGGWEDVAELDISRPVQGFEAVGDGVDAGDWQPGLTALPVRTSGAVPAFKSRNRINLRRLRPGSDIVAFRRVEPGVPLASPLQRDVDAVVVSADGRAFRADDFVLVSTCEQAALFRVTTASTAGGRMTLARSDGQGAFANRAGHSLLPHGLPYGDGAGPQGATVARIVSEVYFVARAAGRNADAWSLWRKTSTRAPAELVAGVEGLQLLFGIDETPANGNTAVERYVDASAVGGNAVLAMHVSVVLSGIDGAPRRTFARTVAFRN